MGHEQLPHAGPTRTRHESKPTASIDRLDHQPAFADFDSHVSADREAGVVEPAPAQAHERPMASIIWPRRWVRDSAEARLSDGAVTWRAGGGDADTRAAAAVVGWCARVPRARGIVVD